MESSKLRCYAQFLFSIWLIDVGKAHSDCNHEREALSRNSYLALSINHCFSGFLKFSFLFFSFLMENSRESLWVVKKQIALSRKSFQSKNGKSPRAKKSFLSCGISRKFTKRIFHERLNFSSGNLIEKSTTWCCGKLVENRIFWCRKAFKYFLNSFFSCFYL